MPRVPISELPDDSRLWVFPAGRRLDKTEKKRLSKEVRVFLDGWVAHGSPLNAGAKLRDDWFLMVAVDPASVPPTGCSIDALVNSLRAFATDAGTSLLSHSSVWFRDSDGEVVRVSRVKFKQLARRGLVNPATRVFDTAIISLASLRQGRFEVPAARSWHVRLMRWPLP